MYDDYDDNNKQKNNWALLGIVVAFLIPILGLIFSVMGLKKSSETNSGKKLSIAGIIISLIQMILSFIYMIL